MISNTSWASYSYAMIILYAMYYLLAGIYYYKKELVNLISGKTVLVRLPARHTNSIEVPSLYMQSVIDEVIAFCAQASGHNYTKTEILHALKLLLQKHAATRQSADAGRLDRVIRAELEKGCSIRISQAELEMLWVS